MEVVDDISAGQIPTSFEDKDRALLEYVEKLTRHPQQMQSEDAQRLRDTGWTEAQIAEAVYITALFAFFNRVADAFGLTDPGYRQMQSPPQPAERYQ